MATKSLLLAAVVLALAVSLVEAGKQPPLVIVSGVVPCSAGDSINATAAPPFPNAVVRLVCGRNVIASATADPTGAYTMNMGRATLSLLAPLLRNQCKVVVVTQLVACNASLASVTGTLAAPVQLLDIGSDSPAIAGVGGIIGGAVGGVGSGIISVDGISGGILNVIPLTFSVV